jgi:hypothetical protein
VAGGQSSDGSGFHVIVECAPTRSLHCDMRLAPRQATKHLDGALGLSRTKKKFDASGFHMNGEYTPIRQLHCNMKIVSGQATKYLDKALGFGMQRIPPPNTLKHGVLPYVKSRLGILWCVPR